MRTIAACLGGLLLAGVASAATIIVKPDGTGDYPTIQAAVDAAAGGDEIVLEPGTYTGVGNRDIDFAGKTLVVRSTNPDDPSVVAATVLDCEGTEASPHRGFRFASGEGVDSVVAGLTIRSGYGPTESIEGDTPSVGGAIACIGSSPTVRNCQLLDNAAGYGGAIFCYQSSPTVSGCTISDNAAVIDGGGVYCAGDSAPAVADCTITGNSAQSEGGGLALLNGSDAVISDSTISANTAVQGGGGIHCFYSSPTVQNCRLTNNAAEQFGGGVDCFAGSSPTITDCTITGNTAGLGGGVNSQFGSQPTLQRCLLRDNTNYAIHNTSSSDIEASGCYWGTCYHDQIAAAIFDHEDDPGGGTVTWWPYFPDFDDSGLVDVFDAIILVGAFGSAPGDPAWDQRADSNVNDLVDVFDVINLVNTFGQSVGAAP